MSPLPGTQIISRASAPPRSAPTDTGVAFFVGTSDRGSHTAPRLIRSLTEFVTHYGDRQSYSVLYDAVESFFREGGGRLYLGRVVGPTPVLATKNLLDGAAAVALTVNAKSVGSWGNDLNVAVTAGSTGGTFVITITADSDTSISEVSGDLADTAEAVAWSELSEYVDITQGVSVLDPAVAAAANLTLGDDDRSNVTNTEWEDALNLFTKDLGPGQVLAPGRTTTTGHEQLLEHASTNNRIALLDAPDTTTRATITAAAAAVTEGLRFGAMFSPWAKVPGITPNTTRTVPYSAIQAGLMARNDGQGLSPNVPAAGDNGISSWAVDLATSWNDTDRLALHEAGVNVARVMYGSIRTYGYRTLVSENGSDRDWLLLSNARLAMAIAAKGDVIMERYVLAEIDGQGKKLKQLEGELIGMVAPYEQAGSLFTDSAGNPGSGYLVDAGFSVNTPELLAAQELHAVVALRMSPMAELSVLELVKVPTSEAVA